MRRLLLPLGLAAIWLSPFSVPFHVDAQAQAAATLGLDEAQALALSRSFALSAAQRQLEASDGALRQAGASPNPALNASVEDTRRATRTTTATLDFPIETGGKRAARVLAAERAKAYAQAEVDGVKASLRAEVQRAFHGVLIAQERFALANDSAQLAGRAADAVGKRVAAGKISPVDAARANVDQANARLEALEADAELQAARQALAALWGESQLGFTQLRGDVERAGATVASADVLQAIDDAPGLIASRIEIARREALIDVERSRGVPDVTLSLGAKRDNDLGLTQAIVGVSIPLPFFDRNQGATYEAVKLAEKASDEHRAMRVRLVAELQQAARQLATSSASAQALKTTVLPAAQQAYDAATRGFEAGKFGFLDVLDAQRSLLQARVRYLAALSASNQAATTIDRLLGR